MQARRMTLSIRSYGGRESVHAHEFHQIVLPVVGTMELRVGDATGSIAAHRGVMMVGGTRHAFRALGENCFVVFDVPPAAAFPDGLVARASAAPFFAIDEPLAHLARYVSGEASSGRLDDGAASHVTALLANSLGRQVGRRDRRAMRIERALDVIDARYAEPLTVAELARSAGMSMSRFHERFRRDTGQTPAEWLAAIRLDRAADLLRQTGMAIAEIALCVGFSDQSALTRSFRRRRGTTPAALRRSSGAG